MQNNVWVVIVDQIDHVQKSPHCVDVIDVIIEAIMTPTWEFPARTRHVFQERLDIAGPLGETVQRVKLITTFSS